MEKENKLTFKPLKKGKTIFLFEIDGTLKASRKEIKENMINCLTSIKTHKDIEIASVGGSDAKKAKEQLLSAFTLFNYVFTENGLVSYDSEGKIFHSKKISSHLGEDKLKTLINFCLKYIADLDIPIKRGTFVEYRTGLINVSPIGRNCSLEERLEFNEYNKTHKVIEKFKEEVEKKFAKEYNLKFSIGGQISFDVFPVGWDKTYCLQFLKDFDNVIFFGDKTYPGGNDYEIAVSDNITRGYNVKGPEDTIEKINNLVKELQSL